MNITVREQGQTIVLPLDVPKIVVTFEADTSAAISYSVLPDVSVDQEISLIFQGDRSSGEFTGVLEATGSSVVKMRLIIAHSGKDTDCLAEMRGVGSGTALIDCRGVIQIQPGATGTDTLYRADFLKDTGTAQVMAIPALEIHESNIVQASHGVSVGHVDYNQVYYMQARGMSPELARATLLNTFLGKTT